MSSRRYLLDTNAVIAHFDKASSVHTLFKPDDDVAIPIIVVGELYFGVYNSARFAQNIAQVEAFLADRRIVSCDVEAARLYGVIDAETRQIGRQMPPNDVWIAALAVQYNATLVTRDAHFGYVDRLSILGW